MSGTRLFRTLLGVLIITSPACNLTSRLYLLAAFCVESACDIVRKRCTGTAPQQLLVAARRCFDRHGVLYSVGFRHRAGTQIDGAAMHMNVYCSEEIAALASHQEIRGCWDLEHRRPSGTGCARGKSASEVPYCWLSVERSRCDGPSRWCSTWRHFAPPFWGGVVSAVFFY